MIELHLAKRGVGDRELVVPAEPKDKDAQPAETEFVSISRAGPRVTFMALRPHTGRTHQLRAHMKAIGHPILGDPKYSDEKSTQLSEGLKPQLHARSVMLPHPRWACCSSRQPISPELKAGFAKFGFSEDEADQDLFAKRQIKRR